MIEIINEILVPKHMEGVGSDGMKEYFWKKYKDVPIKTDIEEFKRLKEAEWEHSYISRYRIVYNDIGPYSTLCNFVEEKCIMLENPKIEWHKAPIWKYHWDLNGLKFNINPFPKDVEIYIYFDTSKLNIRKISIPDLVIKFPCLSEFFDDAFGCIAEVSEGKGYTILKLIDYPNNKLYNSLLKCKRILN